jgi:peptide deformylase
MIRQILIWPDKKLAQAAEEVTVFDAELRALADDMVETMQAANGKGLAAPQIGVLKSVIVVDLDGQPTVLVNPACCIEQCDKQNLEEGCLSIPGIFERVERFAEVKVLAKDLAGVDMSPLILKGYDAVAVQHECEHLAGVMFVDRLSPLKRDIVRKKMLKLKR